MTENTPGPLTVVDSHLSDDRHALYDIEQDGSLLATIWSNGEDDQEAQRAFAHRIVELDGRLRCAEVIASQTEKIDAPRRGGRKTDELQARDDLRGCGGVR